MKAQIIVLCTLFISGLAIAGEHTGEMKSNAGFEKMKTLVGSWKGKDADGKAVAVSYKVVSAGSTVMETLDMMDTPEAMVTMYHVNGDKLMMTHYCSMGNQPRMRADKMSADGSMIAFTMYDASNLAKKTDAHMSKLVLTFKDADHFIQEWSMSQDGKVAHVGKFEFERAK
jgi:hypothetical protein